MLRKATIPNIIAGLATVLFCVISAVLFITILLPIQIIRLLVSVAAKFLRPDLIQLVSKRSSVWTQDDLSRPESNITVVAIFDRNVRPEDFRKEFESKVLLKKIGSNTLQFPRLQQYYEYWCNFSFWKWEGKFNLKQHLTAHEKIVTSKDDLLELANQLNRRAWNSKQSPWSGVLVEKYSSETIGIIAPCSAWIFTIHHSLAGAYAIQCLINSLLDGRMGLKPPYNDITINEAQGKSPTGFLETIRHVLRNIFVLVKDLIQVGSNQTQYDRNMIKDRQILYNNIGNDIPYATVEEIQSKLGVSLTAVLGTMVGAGLQKMIQGNRIIAPVPEFVNVMFPYSHPGHSMDLSNYQAFVFLKIPVAFNGNSKKRLELVEKSVLANRTKGLSKIYSKLPIILGGLPGFLIKLLYRVDLPSGVLISLCIDTPIHFQDAKVMNLQFISGPLPGTQGIFFFFMKFMNEIDFGIGLSESFTKKYPQASQMLIQDMLEELDNLSKLAHCQIN